MTLFVGTLLFFLLILLFYRKFHIEKIIKEQEKQEHVHLKQYIFELENYNAEVKKFRHDYQNVLSSLEIFIINDDMEALREYYQTHIKKDALILNQNIHMICDLSKLKLVAIQSILANKLMQAQEKGIKVVFEAIEDVDEIPADPVRMVRILGIILDNAIEEVESLEYGEIHIAVFYKDTDLVFAFENTCRANIEGIHELVKEGYSTKGEERGKGLTILKELTSQVENIHLEIEIKDQLFVQIIIISQREVSI